MRRAINTDPMIRIRRRHAALPKGHEAPEPLPCRVHLPIQQPRRRGPVGAGDRGTIDIVRAAVCGTDGEGIRTGSHVGRRTVLRMEPVIPSCGGINSKLELSLVLARQIIELLSAAEADLHTARQTLKAVEEMIEVVPSTSRL